MQICRKKRSLSAQQLTADCEEWVSVTSFYGNRLRARGKGKYLKTRRHKRGSRLLFLCCKARVFYLLQAIKLGLSAQNML
jgi:hypothetical protein